MVLYNYIDGASAMTSDSQIEIPEIECSELTVAIAFSLCVKPWFKSDVDRGASMLYDDLWPVTCCSDGGRNQGVSQEETQSDHSRIRERTLTAHCKDNPLLKVIPTVSMKMFL